MTHRKCTTLVLGSGIAGLTYALKAARWGSVILLTKKDRAESSTNRAQGGIASVMGDDDSFDLHVQDTLEAGAGLCRRDAVEVIVQEGPRLVRELMSFGADFSLDDEGSLQLGREGGHSRRRIVHARDRTGWEIERTLLDAVEQDERIQLFEDHLALDLWVGGEGSERRCHGALWFDPETGELGLVEAQSTFLSTGGAGKVYLYTTNPDIATGDGVAMAARAGCPIVNLEFFQFHPTCLYHPDAKSFLISEAVRGEGAYLTSLDGDDFLADKHPLGSLAPRDVVAREIDRQMKERGDKYVLLDVSKIGEARFAERFPQISTQLVRYGLRPGVDPIPVVPAAHYLCGGVAVDLFGRTPIRGLFAAGEVACTGVHGANRLASNSLLEALVFAERAASIEPEPAAPAPEPPIAPGEAAPPTGFGVMLDHEWDVTRRVMWDYVGLARTPERLGTALGRLADMYRAAEELYRSTRPSRDLAELRNLAQVGWMIAAAARGRTESRGLHYLPEQPARAETARESVLYWDSEAGPRVEYPALGAERPVDVR